MIRILYQNVLCLYGYAIISVILTIAERRNEMVTYVQFHSYTPLSTLLSICSFFFLFFIWYEALHLSFIPCLFKYPSPIEFFDHFNFFIFRVLYFVFSEIVCQDNRVKLRRCQIEFISFSAHVDYAQNSAFIRTVSSTCDVQYYAHYIVHSYYVRSFFLCFNTFYINCYLIVSSLCWYFHWQYNYDAWNILLNHASYFICLSLHFIFLSSVYIER